MLNKMLIWQITIMFCDQMLLWTIFLEDGRAVTGKVVLFVQLWKCWKLCITPSSIAENSSAEKEVFENDVAAKQYQKLGIISIFVLQHIT